MFIGQSCGWLLSRPVLWARHRRSQLRADPSRSAEPGALGPQSGRSQADAGQTQHDQARDGLHRVWESADGDHHHQRSELSVVLAKDAKYSPASSSSLSKESRGQWIRRLRVGWLLCLLLLIPLRDTQAVDAQQYYDNARRLLVHGDLEKCQLKAEQGYRQFETYVPRWA